MEGGAVGGGASVGGGGSVGGRVGSAVLVVVLVGRGVRVNLRVRVGAMVRVAVGSIEEGSVAVAVPDGSGVTIWASEAKREPGVWAKAGFGPTSSPPTHAATTDGPPPITKPTAKLNRMAPATIARTLIIPTVSCKGVSLRGAASTNESGASGPEYNPTHSSNIRAEDGSQPPGGGAQNESHALSCPS
jgi:hypothetical protein